MSSEVWRDLDGDVTTRLAFAQVRKDGAGDRAEVHGAKLDRGAADLREIEKVVDQPAHALIGCANPPQMMIALLAELTAEVGLQSAAEPVDGAKRCAEV